MKAVPPLQLRTEANVTAVWSLDWGKKSCQGSLRAPRSVGEWLMDRLGGQIKQLKRSVLIIWKKAAIFGQHYWRYTLPIISIRWVCYDLLVSGVLCNAGIKGQRPRWTKPGKLGRQEPGNTKEWLMDRLTEGKLTELSTSFKMETIQYTGLDCDNWDEELSPAK